MISYKNLGSSSKGNCSYFEIKLKSGYIYKMFIDVGFEKHTLINKCFEQNIDLLALDSVLITHEHKDHSKGLDFIKNMNVKVFAPDTVLKMYNIPKYSLMNKMWFKIYEGIEILPLELEHYDDDKKQIKVKNFCYIIKVENEKTILYITDTIYIPYNLSQFKFDYIFVECNYLHYELFFGLKNAREKKDYGNEYRYTRLLNSHLSNVNCVKFLNTLNLSKTLMIVLLHLSSSEKTNRYKFKQYIKENLKDKKTAVYVAIKEGGLD